VVSILSKIPADFKGGRRKIHYRFDDQSEIVIIQNILFSNEFTL